MKKFITGIFSPEEADVIALGVPVGKHANETLKRLRELNWFVESFDVDRKKDLLKNVKVADVGDLVVNDGSEITGKIKEISSKGKIPLILGKSHLLTFFALKGFDEDTKLVVLDAHADIKDSFMDEKITESIEPLKVKNREKYNAATWLRRLCEIFRTENILHLGLRSCDEKELEFIQDSKITYFTSTQIRKNLDMVKEKVKSFTEGSKIYISFDIDVFDPAIAPGVDHPEPNGIFFPDFVEILDSTKGKIVGFDLVEIRPLQDNEVTEFLAVKTIFQILYCTKKSG